MSKKRLIDIDVAIGISIVLVVYGHLFLDETLPFWYIKSREMIYQFHMPLFMFFSGFLMSYTYKKVNSIEEYKSYILKKASKFLPAYLVFSLIFLGFEFVSGDYSSQKLKLDFIDILVYPSKAPAGFLWYIYVLFQFYLIFPLLEKMVSKNVFIIITIAVIIQFLNVTGLFNLDLFSFYLLFVVLGIISTRFLDVYYKFIRNFGLVSIICFVVLMSFYGRYEIPKLVYGLFSIPVVHYISLKLSNFKITEYLSNLGKHSYHIYLMNTLIIGICYLMIIKELNFEFSLLILIILFLLGLILPVFIYKRIIKPNRFLNKIIK
nr:acyltransferase family protein [uncultured Psychroserpens sp.]